MKKERTICIKNPSLLRIRNECRNLLFAVYSSRMNKLLEEQRVLQSFEAFWDDHHDLYEELHQRYQELSKNEGDLRYALKTSIIYCPICGQIDRDMSFFIPTGEWVCIHCKLNLK